MKKLIFNNYEYVFSKLAGDESKLCGEHAFLHLFVINKSPS